MSTRAQLITAAEENGWRLHAGTRDPDSTLDLELRRANPSDRRRTEYLTVGFDGAGRVLRATWAPQLDGIGARTPASNRRQFVLDRLGRA